jgi:hypothetical protein
MLAPWLLALGLVVGLLVLIPARRLQLSGFRGMTIGLYVAILWLLAMGVAIRPVGARILVPFLLVLYLAPFVAGPDTVRRVFRRRPPGGIEGSSGRPIKDVTPRDGADDG